MPSSYDLTIPIEFVHPQVIVGRPKRNKHKSKRAKQARRKNRRK